MAVDPRFFEALGPVSLGELARETGADCRGDTGRLIKSVGSAANAGSDEICYYDAKKPPEEGAVSSNAGACFIRADFADRLPEGVAAIFLWNGHTAFRWDREAQPSPLPKIQKHKLRSSCQ